MDCVYCIKLQFTMCYMQGQYENGKAVFVSG